MIQELINGMVDGSSMTKYKVTKAIIEARVETKKNMAPKLALSLLDLVGGIVTKIDASSIDASKGDIKRLKFYTTIKKAYAGVENYNASCGIKSKHMETVKAQILFVEANRSSFIKGYKDNNTLLKCTYIASIISIVDLVQIMSGAAIKHLNNDTDFDKGIESSKINTLKLEYVKGLYVENAQDLKKVLGSKVSVIEGFDPTLYNEDEMIIEASFAFYLEIAKMGLAKLLYVLLGFLRYIIYYFFYLKESVMSKVDTLSGFVDYLETNDGEKRQQIAKKLETAERNNTMKSIDANAEANKMIEKSKINEVQFL